MKAMIFAAGRGNRMRPLTDTCPKPLLKVRGRPLIVWHIVNLVRAGITEIVINHAHLGEQIEEMLGDGSRYGATISYSHEESALETAGGIAKARHLLGEEPFVTIAADVYCPYFDFEEVKTVIQDNDVWGKPYDVAKRDVCLVISCTKPVFSSQRGFCAEFLYGQKRGRAQVDLFRYRRFPDVDVRIRRGGRKSAIGHAFEGIYLKRARRGGNLSR